MLSVRVRKVAFAIVSIAIVSFIAYFIVLFLAISSSSATKYTTTWFLIVDFIVVNGVGIVAGLLWEKSTRSRYLIKLQNTPAPSERIKKVYNVILVIAVIVAAFYVFSNLWAAYEMFALHLAFTIPPATQAEFYVALFRYLVLALVFLWLYFEPKPKDGSPLLNIKSGLLVGIIYFFVMAALTVFGMVTMKVAAGTASIQVSGIGTNATSSETNTLAALTAQYSADLQNQASWQPAFLGPANTEIGHLTLNLPRGYGVQYINTSTALARVGNVPDSYYVKVSVNSGTVSDMVGLAKATLGQLVTPQDPLSIATSTIAGSQATSISVAGNGHGYVILPFAGDNNKVIVMDKQYDNADVGNVSLNPLENEILDDIANSLQFSAAGNSSASTEGFLGEFASTTMTFGPAQNNTYYIGSTYPVTWATPDWAKGLIVEIELWRANGTCFTDPETGVQFCGTMIGLIHGSNTFNGSYDWQIPGEIVPGDNYMVSVSFNGLAGAQSAPFSIAAPLAVPQPAVRVAPSPRPSITIISPSSGDTWQIGQEQTVKWISTGVKSVVIFIHSSDGTMCREGITPAASGEYSFVLTPSCFNVPTQLTPGQYTINITDDDPGSGSPEDWSQPFNIIQ